MGSVRGGKMERGWDIGGECGWREGGVCAGRLEVCGERVK